MADADLAAPVEGSSEQSGTLMKCYYITFC